MPYINLGNLITPPQGASFYSYKYNSGTKTHEFNGIGQFGFCQCLRSYGYNDKIKINNVNIIECNTPMKIQAYSWITFIVENNKMYIFNKTTKLLEIPDGSTISPINDVTIWCACAGINWYDIGQPNLETLTNSQYYCDLLFSNENSFTYYKRSNKIIKSTILGTNVIDNLERKNYFSSAWVKGLSNSPPGYETFTSIPKYTGNDNWCAWGAFSGDGWYLTTNNEQIGNGQYCQLKIPNEIWPYKMTIYPAYGASYPIGGTVLWQCSKDGNEWFELDSQQTSNTANVLHTFYNTTGITGKYQYFRLTLANSSQKNFWAATQGKVHGFL